MRKPLTEEQRQVLKNSQIQNEVVRRMNDLIPKVSLPSINLRSLEELDMELENIQQRKRA